MLDQVKSERKSNWVIRLAQFLNAVLTFMFAANYLPGVFDIFEFMDTGLMDSLFVRALAGAFAIVVFDGAYHAWGAIRRRDGLTTEQMDTADTAKNASLYGSLAASLGQFVLGQEVVVLSDTIVFGVSVIAMLFVAIIAVMHMYWWDKFNGESFDAVEQSHNAQNAAEKMRYAMDRQEELEDLQRAKEEAEHLLIVEQTVAENQLLLERSKAEADLERDLVMQQIEMQRELNQRVRKNMQAAIDKEAAKIAEEQSEELTRRFKARLGVNVNGSGGHPN